MKLITITQEKNYNGEASIINFLFENGMSLLHIRKPQSSRIEMENLLQKIKPEFYNGIVIHDHFDLAIIFNLRGIHLNSRSKIEPLHHKLSISRSCHTIDEIANFSNLNYVFLSPIFDSISKQDYKHAFSEEELFEAGNRKIINEKVIALGGINVKTIPVAVSFGFGGVAVLGALWGNFEKDQNKEKLLGRLNELQQICNPSII